MTLDLSPAEIIDDRYGVVRRQRGCLVVESENEEFSGEKVYLYLLHAIGLGGRYDHSFP